MVARHAWKLKRKAFLNAIKSAAVSIFAFLDDCRLPLWFFRFKHLAVDCTWEEWGEWSACPDECGVSKVFRSRGKNEHECGGLACTGLSTDEKKCDRHAQMKMENDQCQKENKRLRDKLCQNVLCHNGGTCQEGECICDDGYSGSICAEEDIIWATGENY